MIGQLQEERVNFGERIAHYRKRAGLTQEELGLKLGYRTRYKARCNVSQLERHERFPRVEIIKALARIFNVTVDEMVGDGDSL